MTDLLPQIGRLVRFEHPLPLRADAAAAADEIRLLRRLERELAEYPRLKFWRKLAAALLQRARDLPFPSGCLVVNPRQLKRLGEPPVLPWRGDALGRLAVITQSTSRIWMRSRPPQLHRAAPKSGGVCAVTLLLPADFSDPRSASPAPRRLHRPGGVPRAPEPERVARARAASPLPETDV